MGCGAHTNNTNDPSQSNAKAQLKAKHIPIDYVREYVSEPEVDRITILLQNKLKEIESYRIKIVDNLDPIIVATGAFCFKTPKIRNCFDAVLWKISSEWKGNIKDANIEMEFLDFGFVHLNEDYTYNKETKTYMKLIQNYLKEFYTVKDVFNHKKLITEINIILEEAESVYKHLKEENKNSVEYLRELSTKHIYNTNLQSTRLTLDAINKEYEDIINFNNVYLTGCVNNLAQFDEVGKKAFNDRIQEITFMVWNYMPQEDKWMRFADARRLYNEMLRNKEKTKESISSKD